jgi:hypothetical protein
MGKVWQFVTEMPVDQAAQPQLQVTYLSPVGGPGKKSDPTASPTSRMATAAASFYILVANNLGSESVLDELP